MNLRPHHYAVVGSIRRHVEKPEPIADAGLAESTFRQHCADLWGEVAKPIERDVFYQPIQKACRTEAA